MCNINEKCISNAPTIIFDKPIIYKMKENFPLEEVYAKIDATPDPVTGRFKKLVDEFVVSDIHCDRYCEKETVNEDGRRIVSLGTYCASTFVGKLFKMNGPSVNPMKRYLLLIGLSRQNPSDIKQDEKLAIEMAAENAIVDPIMTVWLPEHISGTRFRYFVEPYLNSLPTKMILTSKQAKKKKEKDLKKGWETLIKKAEKHASLLFYHDTLKPLMDIEWKEKYGEAV